MDATVRKPEVIVIPPTKGMLNTRKIRTAAYARVSSDSDDQFNSFMTQMDYYTKYINANPTMEFVDMYADEAVTGTKVDKRDEFNRMMDDCREGRIDLILVKSASRFARNTYDGLNAVRELKSMGINVVFEENGIDTRTMIGESELITAYSIAQEEAVSTSKNVQMGVRLRMRNGTFKQGQAPYGFRVCDGVFTIIEEEAEIVRLIFLAYKEGKSFLKIANELTEMGIKKANGDTKWNPNHIKYILTNVRYKGDALLQKSYTTEFPFKSVLNRGELDMYYVKNTNPAIVSAELFDTVAELLKIQSERFGKGGCVAKHNKPLRGMVFCAECGKVYRLKNDTVTTHWVCRGHETNSIMCQNPQISENAVYDAFVQMYNRLVKNKEYILDRMLKQLKDLKEARHKQNKEFHNITEEISTLTGQILEIERLNSRGYLEPALYHERKSILNSQIVELKKDRKQVSGRDECSIAIKETEKICEYIQKNGSIESFNEKAFKNTVKRIIAKDNILKFELKNGMRLRIEAE